VTSELFRLFEQGRYDEAREIGVREIETANRVGLRVTRGNIDMPLALSEAKLGDFEGACKRIECLIEERMTRGMHGVALGAMHELRARIAIWMNDAQAFEAHAQLCAQHFRKSGGEPALAAKYARLLQEARHDNLAVRSDTTDAMATQTTVARTARTSSKELERAVSSALIGCGSRLERLRRAVELLANAASAQHAELFVPSARGLSLAASTTEGLAGQSLVAALSRMLDVGKEASATSFTATLELSGSRPQAVRPYSSGRSSLFSCASQRRGGGDRRVLLRCVRPCPAPERARAHLGGCADRGE